MLKQRLAKCTKQVSSPQTIVQDYVPDLQPYSSVTDGYGRVSETLPESERIERFSARSNLTGYICFIGVFQSKIGTVEK